jgi:hypothetical protein
MKKALKEAGQTIAEYIDPAPGNDRDAEETLDEIIGLVDNDEVGRAIAQSDKAEGLPDTEDAEQESQLTELHESGAPTVPGQPQETKGEPEGLVPSARPA